MSFLQPILLAGLPLVALPILIHLINRWRHRTLPWGAMMFLLNAKRLNRGMARLRFWLIMLTRMLAIATLILALARPLVSVWQGLSIGGHVETSIVLLDRSASMEQQDLQTRRSKRRAVLDQITSVISSYGRGSRIVLIENVENKAQEIESAESLLDRMDTSATATTADIPGMVQTALDYIVANETGRTDIWISSDLRANDWNPNDGRWTSVRDKFQTLKAVKFYLLSYAEPASDNMAVRVFNVHQRDLQQGRELVFDAEFRREGDAPAAEALPCELVINGARSVINIDLSGDRYLLQGHKVPIDERLDGGWGRVEIPADENPLDNSFYFVFTEPPVHHTTIVYENPQVAEPLRIAATAPLDPSIHYMADMLPTDRSAEIGFTESSLILWQAELPTGELAEQLERFVRSGRPVIFFPPEPDSTNSMFGNGWGDWQRVESDAAVRVASWRGDSDLLAHAASGEPLGLGELRTYSYREILGKAGNSLARLEGGVPLLLKATSGEGHAYFYATLPILTYSSLAQDGVAFYASIQRALATGAATQSNARQLDAGTTSARKVTDWQPAEQSSRDLLLSTRWMQSGSYNNGPEWLALNRPASEDLAPVLEVDEVDRLFGGLDFRHVKQSVDKTGTLTSEIWRAVLACMGVALILEACLCMPEQRSAARAQSPAQFRMSTEVG